VRRRTPTIDAVLASAMRSVRRSSTKDSYASDSVNHSCLSGSPRYVRSSVYEAGCAGGRCGKQCAAVTMNLTGESQRQSRALHRR
jgi:hypothetical protein